MAALCTAVLFCLVCVLGPLSASSPSTASGEGGCTVSGKGSEIPANYFPWLPEAAAKYKLGPKGVSIVAAIHYVESDWGQSPLPGVAPGTHNSAGAEGPGEFLVPSWEAYGVDGNGDGVKDVYSIPDSVFGTANLLHADGAPQDWHGAIFDYNHAEWYVEEVLEKAASLHVKTMCTAGSGELAAGAAESLERIESVAKWMESKKIHYCWGGGHGVKPGPSGGTGEFCPPGTEGLDCSGSVRWLMVLSGYPDPGGLVSNELGAQYPSGVGKEVTIWSNPDHIWMEINGRDWGTATSNFSHGPGFGPQSTAGFAPSHPPGL
jgi:hypothetical protein